MKKHITTRKFYEKYERLVRKNRLDLSNSEFTKNYDLEKLYEEDPNLNNIPLKVFDKYFYIGRLYNKETWPKSLAENTCMYKHAIIYDILGCKPEFKEEIEKE